MTVQGLLNAARDGDRLVLIGGERPRRLWPGLGNRSGLHSFAGELLREKWKKGNVRLQRKLERLAAGSTVEVHTFRNRTRDRGRWEVLCAVVI